MSDTVNPECIHAQACMRHVIRADALRLSFAGLSCESCCYMRSSSELLDVMTGPDAMKYADQMRLYLVNRDYPCPFAMPMRLGDILGNDALVIRPPDSTALHDDEESPRGDNQ